MNKTLKIITTVLMVIFTVASFSQVVLAADTATSIIDGISADTSSVDATKLQTLANNVLGLIQIASAVAAVILVAVFGFKFILGSANEKADYQKSFIPLIVGVVVVFAASSIAKLLFSTFANLG
jgi:type IV secretory pathway VirB2 component (pilin)